jgi:hypothetical protein
MEKPKTCSCASRQTHFPECVMKSCFVVRMVTKGALGAAHAIAFSPINRPRGLSINYFQYVRARVSISCNCAPLNPTSKPIPNASSNCRVKQIHIGNRQPFGTLPFIAQFDAQRVVLSLIDEFLDCMPDLPVRVVVFAFPLLGSSVETKPTSIFVLI